MKSEETNHSRCSTSNRASVLSTGNDAKYAERGRLQADVEEASDEGGIRLAEEMLTEWWQTYKRAADEDMAGGRNTITRFADADLCTP